MKYITITNFDNTSNVVSKFFISSIPSNLSFNKYLKYLNFKFLLISISYNINWSFFDHTPKNDKIKMFYFACIHKKNWSIFLGYSYWCIREICYLCCHHHHCHYHNIIITFMTIIYYHHESIIIIVSIVIIFMIIIVIFIVMIIIR